MKTLLIVFIYTFVNFLMLRGILVLFRIERPLLQQLIAFSLSGCYVLLYLLTKNTFLRSFPVYCIFLIITTVIAFGPKKESFPAMFSYVLIYLSFAGTGYHLRNTVLFVIGTAGILIISFVVTNRGVREYVYVKLKYNNQNFSFKALIDTGNLLKDPFTGKPVLVVGSDIAQQMTGLSINQLRCPLDSICALPGLRLIPYNTIGQSGVFLLGMYIDYLKIGKWQGSGVIAFSPEILCKNGSYQALTGGYV